METNDAGEAALALAERHGGSLHDTLSRTAAAQQLAAVGLTDDIAYCLTVDRHDVVPQLRERQITL
jgi:phosphosulfolactate phosphohydrolase-like enzyme